MSKKNYAVLLVIACLVLISGLVFLFDALDVAFDGMIAKWYLVLLLVLTGTFIGVAIIRNAPVYYTIASIFAGIFLSMSLNKPFSDFWALIPICISFGMMVSYFVSHGRLRYLKFAIILLILSIILLIGSLTDSWEYIVPAELIAIGIITIVYVCVKLTKIKKKFSNEEEDYHIRPTKEINNKEDM